MGALDRPTETFTVYPSTDGEDDFGGKTRVPGNPDGQGMTGKGWITQPKSDSTVAEGYDTAEVVVLTARSLPFGGRSVVRWQDRLWDVPNEPVERNHTPATRKASCLLVARSARAR